MDRLLTQRTKAGIDIDAPTEPVPLNLTALGSAAQPQFTERPGCAFGAGFPAAAGSWSRTSSRHQADGRVHATRPAAPVSVVLEAYQTRQAIRCSSAPGPATSGASGGHNLGPAARRGRLTGCTPFCWLREARRPLRSSDCRPPSAGCPSADDPKGRSPPAQTITRRSRGRPAGPLNGTIHARPDNPIGRPRIAE